MSKDEVNPGDATDGADEPLVAVAIPPLITTLVALSNRKGAPLTEQEVIEARDGAICMTMRASVARRMAEERGYDDIAPENAWEEWQAFLASGHEDG